MEVNGPRAFEGLGAPGRQTYAPRGLLPSYVGESLLHHIVHSFVDSLLLQPYRAQGAAMAVGPVFSNALTGLTRQFHKPEKKMIRLKILQSWETYSPTCHRTLKSRLFCTHINRFDMLEQLARKSPLV